MKQVEKVWAAISAHKENLSTHKVELSLVSDMETILKQAEQTERELRDGVFKARDLEENLNDVINFIQKDTDILEDIEAEASRLLSQFEQAANNLGVNPRDNKAFTQLNDKMDDIRSTIIDGQEY